MAVLSSAGRGPTACAGSLRAGVLVSCVLLASCASTARYGTHRLRKEWSLFGVCGPYSRAWLEDGSGEQVLWVEESLLSPDRRWLALFDTSASSALHLLDVQADVLRPVPTGADLCEETARWSPDGERLAVLAGGDRTRLCVVTVGAEPAVEWPADDARDPAELRVDWRDGTARIR